MTCPSCNKPTESIKSSIINGHVVSGCSSCLPTLLQGNIMSPQHAREAMKREYRADLVQPIEKDFAKRYGIAKAKEAGWTDEQIRRNT